MDERQSRAIAQCLLQSQSAEEIRKIVEHDEWTYWFSDPGNWMHYGSRPKNWDTVGNQQANAVGALVELITNGIDAMLLRKCREAGIKDPRGTDAPQSMFEAVKAFFPDVVGGRISNLDSKQRTELAEKSVIVGVKRADRANGIYPTYTVIDFGDGQLAQDFSSTFLSLGERNKEGIPFVQGKFNMGSSGSLRFCTRSDILLGHYKLLISKRPGQEWWGWTLIRVRKPRDNEGLPVAEYFAPGGKIKRFRAETLPAFGHESIGVVSEGTVVKLYEFDIGKGARTVDFGLDNALTVNLVDCALPVRIYDFDAKPQEGKGDLRKQGIAARTFSGMNVTLYATEDEQKSSPETEWQHVIVEEKHEELGIIKVVATGIRKLRDSLKDQPARVFYTVNGQTHAIERASLLNHRVGLGDLRNHLIINVVCDGMDKTALANIFMPDRERKANNNQSRKLEELVVQALKNDDKLRSYAAEIRLRRAAEFIEEKEESVEILEDMVKSDPDIQELFGLGTILPQISRVPGGALPFEGKKFPSFLKPLNLRNSAGRYAKEVPINATRRIECGTDAENEYLSRIDSAGETWCSLRADEMPHSVKLRNGTATFSIRAPKGAKPGDTQYVEFGFKDHGPNVLPLKFGVHVEYIEAEETASAKPGKKSNTKEKITESLALPRFEWVSESSWGDHDFDETSGAYVSVSESITVFVNRDNKSLRLMRSREKDEASRGIFEAMFRLGLGIFALSIHRKALEAEKTNEPSSISDADDVVKLATKAIAPHIITVIKRLGGTNLST
jgi:hypothetical protein